jgi:uncharacterized protein (DUF58 family)
MVDVTRSFTATSEFVVAPVIDPLPPVEPPRSDELGDSAGSHSVGAHGADDQSTREYRMGDDLRKIHWRSSARTGVLMVRQEERPWRSQTSVLLDLRAGAHAASPVGPDPQDPRLTSSLEWAISAAASVGNHAVVRGYDLALIGDPATERLRLPDTERLASHLATVRELQFPNLMPLAAAVRSGVRDSSFVAVLGRLDAASLRMLADAHPRGRSSPAFALLLDVDTWRDAEVPPNREVLSAAAVLRNAGWRVTTVTCGETMPQAWELLLAGFTSSARVTPVLR